MQESRIRSARYVGEGRRTADHVTMHKQALLLAFAALLPLTNLAAEDFEPDRRSIAAASLLPPEVMGGPYHHVAPEAAVEGLIATFRVVIGSRQFEAHGTPMVAVRVNEAEALVRLRELRNSEVFLDAMKDTAMRPVNAVRETVQDPVGTAKKVPAGVVRLLRRTVRQVEDGYDKVQETVEEQRRKKEAGSGAGDDGSGSGIDAEDVRAAAGKGYEAGKDYALDKVGYNGAYRALARRLGVDPYTDNGLLREEMQDVAWVSAAGSLGMGELMPSIPKEVGYLSDVNDLVWDMHPVDLRLRNEDTLKPMGVSDEAAETFFDNRVVTLTDATRLVQALAGMEHVENRAVMVELAGTAETRVETRFYVAAAELLAAWHRSRGPLTRLVAAGTLPAGLAREDVAVLPVPVDSLAWTADAASAARKIIGAGALREARARQIWVRGLVSARARQELEEAGWSVLDIGPWRQLMGEPSH